MHGEYGAITLGELIDLLRGLPAEAVVTGMDGTIHSWRGSYEMAATAPCDAIHPARVLAGMYADAIGSTLYGWKGGEWEARADEEIHYGDYGDIGNPIIGLIAVGPGVYRPEVADPV